MDVFDKMSVFNNIELNGKKYYYYNIKEAAKSLGSDISK